MKNPEEAIERVLTGLRDAEAPLGMEARILSVLEARVARKDSRTSWRGWMAVYARPLAGGVAIAGACVIGALVVLPHRAGPVARDVRATVSFRGPSKAEKLVPQRLNRQDTGGYSTAEAVPVSKTVGLSNDEGHVDYDSLAVSEMLAPSKPAPPLSLTHQENLLAQVVHHGDPEEVAELKPEVRAKEIEIAKADFHDFFEPPLPASAKESK